MEIQCFDCKKKLSLSDKIGFREDCEYCGHDLHSCVQCQHYNPKVYNECTEPMADRFLDKQKANYCEFFTPQSSEGDKKFISDPEKNLMSQAEALFKKK